MPRLPPFFSHLGTPPSLWMPRDGIQESALAMPGRQARDAGNGVPPFFPSDLRLFIFAFGRSASSRSNLT